MRHVCGFVILKSISVAMARITGCSLMGLQYRKTLRSLLKLRRRDLINSDISPQTTVQSRLLQARAYVIILRGGIIHIRSIKASTGDIVGRVYKVKRGQAHPDAFGGIKDITCLRSVSPLVCM